MKEELPALIGMALAVVVIVIVEVSDLCTSKKQIDTTNS